MSAPETETNPVTPASPIYILGENALSYYLAEKFISAGERVIILSSEIRVSPDPKEISIKESFSLKKKKLSFIPELYTFEPGKLLIITSNSNRLKSDLMLISPQNLRHTPVLIFSFLPDLKYLETYLGKKLIRGYINGWLKLEADQVKTYSGIQIVLNKDYANIDTSLQILGIIQKSGLDVVSEEDSSLAFWNFFAVYAIGSILSASRRQNIFQTLKNKDNHKILDLIAHELEAIIAAEQVEINANEIIKKIFNTPIDYHYPTQEKNPASAHELNQLYKTILDFSSKNKIPTPQIKNMMKGIYNETK